MNVETIAYADYQYSEMLCERHGKARQDAITENCKADGCTDDECNLFEITTLRDSQDIASVEYCAGEHLFCGHCGMDMNRNDEIVGDFAQCWNCKACSVYSEGEGYIYVGEFSRLTETVKGVVPAWVADLLPVGCESEIVAVADHSGAWSLRGLKVAVAWLPSHPAVGAVLVLSDSSDLWTSGHDLLCELAENLGEPAEIASAMADTAVMEFLPARDGIYFISKR